MGRRMSPNEIVETAMQYAGRPTNVVMQSESPMIFGRNKFGWGQVFNKDIKMYNPEFGIIVGSEYGRYLFVSRFGLDEVSDYHFIPATIKDISDFSAKVSAGPLLAYVGWILLREMFYINN